MNCPECEAALVVSPDQTVCVFSNEPNHGLQTWYDCPNCRVSWEDEEL